MEKWVLAGAAVLLLLALWEHRHARKILGRLEQMLDSAFRDSLADEHFDESQLSALETKLAHHLSSCAISAKNLAEERDRIRSLVADISHQTKTPVSNLVLYAQLLEEEDLPERAREQAHALGRQAERLQTLIDSLVKLSRLEAGILTLHPISGPIQPALDSALEQAEPKAREKGVTLESPLTEAAACLDSKWTTEALYNLLDNAVKYTPPGGHVRVRVTAYSMFARIDIQDDGPGIPEEEQPLIFQRFYRSPAAAQEEGVGIGLYLTRQIASGQGGYVKVFSKPGKGAMFSLYLPRTAP